MKTLNLENVKETFDSPDAGGYVCIITGVEDVPEKEYLRVSYDIAEGEYKGFYSQRKKDMGWDCPVTIRSYKEKALGFFKGFVTSVEKSNNGFKWDGKTESQFVKKGVGLVLRKEKYLNSKNEEKVRLVVDSIHSVDAIRNGDFKVPEMTDATNRGTGATANPFNATPTDSTPDDNGSFFDDVDSSDIPF